ncbi:UDP-glucose 4-epimerase [Halobacillus halophilus]|uniref:UDP-glucose 4-epimerase n=1 Tax=Halobacillus halophilus (strain ATCC 35676 / DSM 2266 / JCM 20832 / KCTC 3685 / LMG 17431 / NBRC 102448 / NCIMB 2269) TaxID=866895 RepID=I0JRK1_HALH3|nr:NAD-dependent epimerase/dehydratase family protein [Halobacillus halophilus]ASF40745.1 UDP-glucose 4-epimerase [Halobacillus halophilus]CCG46772.1 UDP-glucose 4-epimerase [Halobacillus halophilus DSM 2266]
MEKVLVTGGCGFIGSHIVENLLEEGFKVAIVDNLQSGKLKNIPDNVEFYEKDITSPDIVDTIVNIKPNYIIHQAAQVSVFESICDIKKDSEINIQGSVNVINAAKEADVNKIVFASSAAVYGNPEYLPIDVNHSTIPLSPYGLSKYTVEQYLRIAKEHYNIDYTVLRYSNVFGPKQDARGEGGVISIFADRIINKADVTIFGDGEQTRDFIYVKDVARANVNAIKNGHGKIYNVSSGEKISINQLFEQMIRINNSNINVRYKAERNGDIQHSLLSNDITREELQWELKYTFNEGLQETVDYLSTS